MDEPTELFLKVTLWSRQELEAVVDDIEQLRAVLSVEVVAS